MTLWGDREHWSVFVRNKNNEIVVYEESVSAKLSVGEWIDSFMVSIYCSRPRLYEDLYLKLRHSSFDNTKRGFISVFLSLIQRYHLANNDTLFGDRSPPWATTIDILEILNVLSQ